MVSTTMKFLFGSLLGKLILAFLVLGVVPAATVGMISYQKAADSLTSESFQKLEAVRGIKTAQIEGYFGERLGDVSVLSSNATVKDAIHAFEDAFYAEGGVENGPLYAAATEQHADWLTQYNDEYGYYDLFLISKTGDIVWTAFKESDLGENIVTVSLADSPIGDVFQKGLTAVSVQDFAPYAPSGGVPAGFVSAPVYEAGDVIGVVALQLPLEAINTIMQQRDGMGETGESYLIGFDKRMRTDSYHDPTGHSVNASFAGTVADNGVDTEGARRAIAGETNTSIIIDYNGNPVLSSYAPLAIAGLEWAILSEIDEAEALIPAKALLNTFLLVLIISIAIVVAAGFYLARTIASGVKNVSEAAEELADEILPQLVTVTEAVAAGDLTKTSDVSIRSIEAKSKDEVGDLGRAFNSMGEQLGRLGEANVSMVANLREIVGQVSETAGDVSAASEQLASASEQAGSATQNIAEQAQGLSKGAQDQESAVTDTTESVKQLGSAIDQIAEGAQQQNQTVESTTQTINEVSRAITEVASNAQEASEGSKSADDAARKGLGIVEQTVEGMAQIKDAVSDVADRIGNLGEQSAEIGKIVAVIDDIAAQTNLLALNAAIEAARAGEQGRGFAVVADEVRQLAERVTTATSEIAGLIDGVQKGVEESVKATEKGTEEVERGSELANEAGESLNEIQAAVVTVTTQVEQISAAAEEVTASSDEMVKSIEGVMAITEETTAATEEMAASNDQVQQAMGSISAITTQTGASVEESSAATEELSSQVEEVVASSSALGDMAGVLTSAVARFKLSEDGQSNDAQSDDEQIAA